MTAGRSYLLSIDAGTGSGRAVLFDASGNEISAVQKEWSHKPDPRFPGAMDFDVEANWQLLCHCIRGALSKGGVTGDQVAAVSATSMREAIVVYDVEGHEIWACSNVDGRSDEQCASLSHDHPELQASLYERTGQTFALAALPRLLWLKEKQPATFGKMDRISMLSDWILFRLSGVLISDPSNAGTTGLLSLDERQWIRDPMEAFSLPSTIFPPVVEAGTPVGKVSTKVADETGLSTSTTVVVGGGDCQIGTIGLDLVREGECAVLGGTFWQQLVNVSPAVRDPNMDLRINPHAVPGLNQMEAISFFVGLAMRWFRDAFGQDELAKANGDPSVAFSLLEKLSEGVPPGAYGILPVFSDVMRYSRWYHAAPSLLNLSLDPTRSGKGAIFRALQENSAIVVSLNLRRVFSLSNQATPNKIVFASGAAKSRQWSQILADVTGLPVAVPKVTEATALGCAAAAAVGVGIFSSLQEASAAFVNWDRFHEPTTQLAEVYDGVREKWQIAYAAQLALVDAGVSTPMWRAPGLKRRP